MWNAENHCSQQIWSSRGCCDDVSETHITHLSALVALSYPLHTCSSLAYHTLPTNEIQDERTFRFIVKEIWCQSGDETYRGL
jgi:hypothetical protein